MVQSTQHCPRCRQPVVAGVLCPECGILEEADDPKLSAPEECPLSDSERHRWRFWFWAMLALGPLGAMGFVLAPLGSGKVLNLLLGMGAGPILVLTVFIWPILLALGAAFCLARWQGAEDRGELIGYLVAGGVALSVLEVLLMILAAGCLDQCLR